MYVSLLINLACIKWRHSNGCEFYLYYLSIRFCIIRSPTESVCMQFVPFSSGYGRREKTRLLKSALLKSRVNSLLKSAVRVGEKTTCSASSSLSAGSLDESILWPPVPLQPNNWSLTSSISTHNGRHSDRTNLNMATMSHRIRWCKIDALYCACK